MPIDLPPIIENYLAWWIAGLIVVFGLVLYGFKDLRRFSLSCAWAISSVSFAESIRRRVLWITPLAIIGVIVVSQFQNPVDEQDAIRQTTKFCLFAAGLVVTITAIILACTNLPREIESRVIFTVVTKPTTRLEIVLGKVFGFARVSAAILLIMGVFTLGYLHLRAWRLRSSIAQRLDSGWVDPVSRPTLEYYRHAGLLSARDYKRPDNMQIYSRLPVPGDDRHWMPGGGEGMFGVLFHVPRDKLVSTEDPTKVTGLGLALFVGYEKSEAPAADPAVDPLSGEQHAPTSLPYLIQNPDATPDQVRIGAPTPPAAPVTPSVTVEIVDKNFNTLVDSKLINEGKAVPLPDPEGKQPVGVMIAPEAVEVLAHTPIFIVQVNAGPGNYEYFARSVPVLLINERQEQILPMPDPQPGSGGRPVPPLFRTRTGTFGQQLRGGKSGVVPVAVYKFRDAPHSTSDDRVPFEIRVGIERSDADPNEDKPTELEVSFIDRSASGKAATGPSTREAASSITIFPETNRTSYFTVPASMVPSKDFNVVVRCLTQGHFLGVTPRSLAMVTADESFALNLGKSLLVLWLLSLLVVIVSVFCSTFLSWPIAVVLTIVILLGRWGVQQLGDATAPGIGNSVVSDLFRPSDPHVVRTISTTVEALAKMLNWVAAVLPDITRFSAIEDLEQGVAVQAIHLTNSFGVILVFGVPLLVLAYVFLRGKEVAP